MTDIDNHDDLVAMWRHRLDEPAGEHRRNREEPSVALSQAGIAFESKNDGAHLVVTHGDKVIDFWPGTGLWVRRGQQKKHRGVRALIQSLKGARP